ncbi:MAG: YfgM family protein [Verrucomicrobiota bacterium]
MESDITQSAAFYKSWAWAEAHKKQLILGVAALVVVGCAVGLFVWQQNQKQVSASEALTKIATQSSAAGKPAPAETFLKVAADYPKTDAGARALLIAGARFFADGKYAEAQAQFQKFLSENQGSDFSDQAQIGVAASLEAQGKTAEAIKAYKDIAERHSTDSVAPQAKLALGRLYEAQGNLTSARDYYEQTARSDYGIIGQEAGMHLEELLAKNPALAQPRSGSTNAPVLNPK